MIEGAAPTIPRPFLLESMGAYKLPRLRHCHHLQLVHSTALAPAAKQADRLCSSDASRKADEIGRQRKVHDSGLQTRRDGEGAGERRSA
jgi:hypothetical protein